MSVLGNTGIKVSKLCFGSLTIGPLQANLSLDEGAEIIKYAFQKGVNFIDTAQLYENYPYIKKALATFPEAVISTKSYSYSKELMEKSLEKARKELDRDVIDIFLLHEQESRLTIKGHWEAVEYLLAAKAKGIIRALGLSTHSLEGVKGALEFPEMEIIHPIVNYQGLGILDGDIDEMLDLLKTAKNMGKGVYGMKPIGGGNLIHNAEQALQWSFKRAELDAVAVGMQSIHEVNVNCALAEGKKPNEEDFSQIRGQKRQLHIEDYCEGCGKCLEKCKHKALLIVEGRVKVKREKCVLCGYCGAACPNFALKII